MQFSYLLKSEIGLLRFGEISENPRVQKIFQPDHGSEYWFLRSCHHTRVSRCVDDSEADLGEIP